MPELGTQIRGYVDQVAAPITLDEIHGGSPGFGQDLEPGLALAVRPPGARPGRRGRWLAVAAAIVVAVGLLAALVAWHGTRTDDRLAVGPTTSAGPTAQQDWSWVNAAPGYPASTEVPDPAMPAGWQTLDYLDVRFSVPHDWVVPVSRSCTPTAPGVVLLPEDVDGGVCSPSTALPASVLTIGSLEEGLTGGVPVTIGTLNGTRYGDPSCATCAPPTYLLPDGHALTVTGPDAAEILATFTDSGAQRLLQRGPLADTTGWQAIHYEGLSLLAPPSWPTVQLGVPPTTVVGPNGITSSGGDLNPGACTNDLFVADAPAQVYLGISAAVPSCAPTNRWYLTPGQGLWIRPTGGSNAADDRTVAHGRINGLAVTAVETPDSPSLDLLVITPRGATVRLSLSSGLDSSVARAILHSLHRAG